MKKSTSGDVKAMMDIQSLMLNGDTFLQKKEYAFAVESFNRALQIIDSVSADANKDSHLLHCLIANSKAKICLGNATGALEDAKRAMEYSENSAKFFNLHCESIQQVGEAYFHFGNFEDSLKYFHRGLHIGPADETGFTHGIQKCNDAILQTINTVNPIQVKEYIQNRPEQSSVILSKPESTRKSVEPSKTSKAQKVNYLNELEEDKIFLESLYSDPVMQAQSLTGIRTLIKESIDYLHSREEFWMVRDLK